MIHAWRYRLDDGTCGTMLSPQDETLEQARDSLRATYFERLVAVCEYQSRVMAADDLREAFHVKREAI